MLTGYLFLAAGAHRLFYDFYEEDLSQADLGPLGSLLNGPIVVAGSLGELVFGAALIVGLLTRWVSIPLAILMLADVVVFHPPNELFSQDRGFESASLRLAACVALALIGSDKVALDNILAIRRRPK